MTCRPRGGFTLIEVVAAVLIFSLGVLMVISLSRSLGVQMERAGVSSIVTVEVQQRMDSLATLPYASLVLGSREDTLTIRGIVYRRTVTVDQFSPLLREITVTMEPVSGPGPTRTTTSFSSARW